VYRSGHLTSRVDIEQDVPACVVRSASFGFVALALVARRPLDEGGMNCERALDQPAHDLCGFPLFIVGNLFDERANAV
jgi:hypothetical protein